HDDVGLHLGRLAGKLQRVADKVRDAVVDFRRLIVVRQDDGVALVLQRVDGGHIGREERPFDRGHDVLDALVEMRGLALDLGVPFERWHGQGAECLERSLACRGRWRQGVPRAERADGFEDWHRASQSGWAYILIMSISSNKKCPALSRPQSPYP